MSEYLEILDFCAFDTARAAKIVDEITGGKDVPIVESESDKEENRGLRYTGYNKSHRKGLGHGLLGTLRPRF